MPVIRVNHIIALLHGIPCLGPAAVPQVHLHTLSLHGRLALLGIQTTPNTRRVVLGEHMLEQTVRKTAIILRRAEELIRPHMHHPAIPEHRLTELSILVQELIEHAVHEAQRLIGRSIQHLAAALLEMRHRPLINEIRAYTGKGQRMSGHIELRHDVHPAQLRELHKLHEFLLGVEDILRRQLMTVGTDHIRLQAEGRIALLEGVLALIHILLVEDVVITQVQMQVIHLEPRHHADDVLDRLKRDGRAGHIQHEATDLETRHIRRPSAGNAATCLSKNLHETAGTPHQTGSVTALHHNTLRTDVQRVTLRLQCLIHRERDAPLSRLILHGNGVPHNRTELAAEHLRQLLGRDNAVAEGEAPLASAPFQQSRHHHGLGIPLRRSISRLQLQLVILADDTLAIRSGHLEGHVHRHLTEERIGLDVAFLVHNLLVVRAKELHLGVLSLGQLQGLGTGGGRGHLEGIRNLLQRLLSRHGSSSECNGKR